MLCFCTDHLDEEKPGLGAMDRKMSKNEGSPKEEGREKQDLELKRSLLKILGAGGVLGDQSRVKTKAVG